MMKHKTILLSLSNTARKYGYVIWHKVDDEKMKSILGMREYINIKIGNVIQKNKHVDWKRRRLGITYTATRNIAARYRNIFVKYITDDLISITFKE